MTNYLGPKETEIISRLSYEKITIITKEQFEKLFGKTVLARQMIYQLTKKGILKPITRGVYFYSPLEAGPAGTQINEFLIPTVLFPKGNYYVGYSTMFNYYGFTEQIFQTFYVLNTSLQRERIVCGIPFKLIKINPERMYGLETINIKETEITVSDKERTLVDLFYFPNPVGGIEKAFDILKEQVKKVDIKKLVKYIGLFPSVSIRKRMGFGLEKAGIAEEELKPILRSINNSSLSPLCGNKSRKGNINNKWKVIVDDSQ